MNKDEKSSFELDDLSESEIETILEDAVWDFCRKAERIVHPYTTSDFIREYFMPDL